MFFILFHDSEKEVLVDNLPIMMSSEKNRKRLLPDADEEGGEKNETKEEEQKDGKEKTELRDEPNSSRPSKRRRMVVTSDHDVDDDEPWKNHGKQHNEELPAILVRDKLPDAAFGGRWFSLPSFC